MRQQDDGGDQQQELEDAQGAEERQRRPDGQAGQPGDDPETREHPEHDARPVPALPGEPEEQPVDGDEEKPMTMPMRTSSSAAASAASRSRARASPLRQGPVEDGLPVQQLTTWATALSTIEPMNAPRPARTDRALHRPRGAVSPWAPTAPARSRGTAGGRRRRVPALRRRPYGPPGWFPPCPDVIVSCLPCDPVPVIMNDGHRRDQRRGPCRRRVQPRRDRQAALARAGEVLRRVDDDLVAVPDVTGQQRLGELVADRRLHQPAQRPGAVDRVEPVERQPLPRGVGDREGEPAGGQATGQDADLDVDDARQLLAAEGPEHHDVVEPVEELRLEVRRGRPPARPPGAAPRGSTGRR